MTSKADPLLSTMRWYSVQRDAQDWDTLNASSNECKASSSSRYLHIDRQCFFITIFSPFSLKSGGKSSYFAFATRYSSKSRLIKRAEPSRGSVQKSSIQKSRLPSRAFISCRASIPSGFHFSREPDSTARLLLCITQSRETQQRLYPTLSQRPS